jgi:hypothetical protein
MLQQHYGMCFSEKGFIGFIDAIKKIYPTYQKNVESVKNISEDIMLAMFEQGFTYHQIIKSGVETNDNVYNFFWEGQDYIIDTGKDYFLQRAIAQGYVELLAKEKNRFSAEPLRNVKYMVKMATKAVKYKLGQEGYVDKGTLSLVLKMVQLMTIAEDNHRDKRKNTSFDELSNEFYNDIDDDRVTPFSVNEYRKSIK